MVKITNPKKNGGMEEKRKVQSEGGKKRSSKTPVGEKKRLEGEKWQ